MSHKPVPDFTETELWAVRSTLKERYGRDTPVDPAEAEVMLGDEAGPAWRPALWWSAKGASFAFIKLDELRAKLGDQPAGNDDDANLTPNFWGD